MGILTARKYVPMRNVEEGSAKAQVADTYYQGAMLFASGIGVTPVPAAGARFAGICTETKTAAIGDEVAIATAGEFGCANTNWTSVDVGKSALCDVSDVSDNVDDLAPSGTAGAGASGDFGVGIITNYNLDGKTWVRMDVGNANPFVTT